LADTWYINAKFDAEQLSLMHN